MSKNLKYTLLAIVFILGYTSLSFELILLRQLINFVGSNTIVTSVIISTILLFLSWGYYIGSTISVKRYSCRKIINCLVICLAGWYVVACSYYVVWAFFYLLKGIESSLYQVIIIALTFSALPSIGLGFITSYFGRIIHHFNSNYTGRFMAVDTVGSVSGSLITTLVLMPLLGVSSAIICLVVLTSLVLILVAKKKDKVLAVLMFLLLTISAVIIDEERILFNNKNVMLDNALARIEIVDTDFDNGKPQTRTMVLNGSGASKISENENMMFAYIKYINDVFLYNLPKDKIHNILILGAGGFTAGLKDTRNNYTFIDVIKQLPEISEQNFLENKLSDNKKFIVQDAYLYMLKDTKKYDFILVDVYSSVLNIPTNFVTADFFLMIKNHLTPDGIMVANIITSPSFKSKYAKRIDNTLRSVFGHSLSRQVVSDETPNPYSDKLYNVIYSYYNGEADDVIYTIDKNSAVFGQ
ncbi:MAG: fused MFS/spermidine synthase [Alphaproteobacteria bacterium]|nr:fused MFS/spermidine synthase [Alphaproteobacteria bacterium]